MAALNAAAAVERLRELLGPTPRAVEDTEHDDRIDVRVYRVGHNVRSVRDDQLARVGDPAGATESGVVRQSAHLVADRFVDIERDARLPCEQIVDGKRSGPP